MSVVWRLSGVFKADANEVASEIESIGDNPTPKDVVNKARDENSVMHNLFEWNDTIAAEKYREQTASKIIRCLVYQKDDEPNKKDEAPIRFFVAKHDGSNQYTPMRLVVRNEDSYQKLVDQAWSDLKAFKRKYERLSAEFEEIFAMIN